jgi:hypothetical protein
MKHISQLKTGQDATRRLGDRGKHGRWPEKSTPAIEPGDGGDGSGGGWELLSIDGFRRERRKNPPANTHTCMNVHGAPD